MPFTNTSSLKVTFLPQWTCMFLFFKVFCEYLKAWRNACNISTQQLATLLGTTFCIRLATLLHVGSIIEDFFRSLHTSYRVKLVCVCQSLRRDNATEKWCPTRHVMSRQSVTCHVLLRCIISCQVRSYHTMSCQVVSIYVIIAILCPSKSRDVMSYHAMPVVKVHQGGLNVGSQLWSLFLDTSNTNNIKIVHLDLKVHKAYVLPQRKKQKRDLE